MAKKKRKKKLALAFEESSNPPWMEGVIPVRPQDNFNFQCSGCGDCCRNVNDAIMLESLDVFRIAQYFKEMGNPVQEIEEVLAKYTTPIPLTDLGYPIFLLNTVGQDNACIFLKENRCSIQPAKPRTCRMYPLSAGPKDTNDGFDYFIISQKPHHFIGPKIRTSDWMKENFDAEARIFTSMEYRWAAELGMLMHKLKDKGIDDRRWLTSLLFFKYYHFDTDKPFMPQYSENMNALKKAWIELLLK